MCAWRAPMPPDISGVRWRTAGAAEAVAVAMLAEASFDPEYREAWTTGQIADLLIGQNAWMQIAEDGGGEPVAFAMCRKVLDEVELLLCATRPDWRQRGLGLAVIRQVAAKSRALGGARLFLEVRASNSAALALYRKAGFAEDGRRPGYYRTLSGTVIDAITLSMQL